MAFEEWWTTDRDGNRVDCRANQFVELHVKAPVCECGHCDFGHSVYNLHGLRYRLMPTSAHFILPLFVMKRQNLSFSWPKTRFVAKNFRKNDHKK